MAWITKQSGTMQIDRRTSLTSPPRLKPTSSRMFPHTRQAGLHDPAAACVQDLHNWLPYQAIEEAAAFLELPASTVLDATFYEEFSSSRVASTPSGSAGRVYEIMGIKLVEKLSEKLGISPDDNR